MDAPLYPPARRYVEPEVVPTLVTTGSVSAADLMAIPAARAVMVEIVPNSARLMGAPQLRAHISNLSFRSLAALGALRGADLDGVDTRLRALNIMSGGLR